MIRRDTYEKKPAGMENYLSAYGWHFSKAMCDWAVSMMKDRSGKKLQPMTREKTTELLQMYGVNVPDGIGYDAVYLINSARADYMGSSIADEMHLARFVGDTLNDPDGYDGMPFTRFYADTIGKGNPILWNDMM